MKISLKISRGDGTRAMLNTSALSALVPLAVQYLQRMLSHGPCGVPFDGEEPMPIALDDRLDGLREGMRVRYLGDLTLQGVVTDPGDGEDVEVRWDGIGRALYMPRRWLVIDRARQGTPKGSPAPASEVPDGDADGERRRHHRAPSGDQGVGPFRPGDRVRVRVHEDQSLVGRSGVITWAIGADASVRLSSTTGTVEGYRVPVASLEFLDGVPDRSETTPSHPLRAWPGFKVGDQVVDLHGYVYVVEEIDDRDRGLLLRHEPSGTEWHPWTDVYPAAALIAHKFECGDSARYMPDGSGRICSVIGVAHDGRVVRVRWETSATDWVPVTDLVKTT